MTPTLSKRRAEEIEEKAVLQKATVKLPVNSIYAREAIGDKLARACIDVATEYAMKLEACEAKLEKAKAALRLILTNVALDWYVDQFSKDETPKGSSSGILQVIHNQGVRQRAATAFQRAREALTELEKE